MAGSNIFMQLITDVGPVMGEGLLDGFEGSIELREFDWGMRALKDAAAPAGGAACRLAAAARSITGLARPVTLRMQPLRIKKRFDVASAQIHFCVDNHLRVRTASITVLCIKPQGRIIHAPGFVLLATDGHFANISVDVKPDGNALEVVETLDLNFKNIKITYLETVGKDKVPTAPFFYPNTLL